MAKNNDTTVVFEALLIALIDAARRGIAELADELERDGSDWEDYQTLATWNAAADCAETHVNREES